MFDSPYTVIIVHEKMNYGNFYIGIEKELCYNQDTEDERGGTEWIK